MQGITKWIYVVFIFFFFSNSTSLDYGERRREICRQMLICFHLRLRLYVPIFFSVRFGSFFYKYRLFSSSHIICLMFQINRFVFLQHLLRMFSLSSCSARSWFLLLQYCTSFTIHINRLALTTKHVLQSWSNLFPAIRIQQFCALNKSFGLQLLALEM